MRSAIVRAWLVRILRRLVLPIKVLVLGHVWLAAYLTALSWALIASAQMLNAYLASRLAPYAQSEGVASWIAIKLGIALPIILILCIIFMLASSVMLATRVIWRHHRFAFGEILRLTPRTLLISLRAISMSLRRAFSTLLPALALLALYIFADHGPSSPGTRRLYEIVTLSVTAVCTYRTLPLLMAPFLAVCGAIGSREALFYSPQLFNKKRPELVLLVVFAGLFGVVMLLLLHYSGIYAKHTKISLMLVLVSCGWYAITSLSIFTMNTLNEFSGAQSSNPPPPQETSMSGGAVKVNKIWVK